MMKSKKNQKICEIKKKLKKVFSRNRNFFAFLTTSPESLNYAYKVSSKSVKGGLKVGQTMDRQILLRPLYQQQTRGIVPLSRIRLYALTFWAFSVELDRCEC